VVADGQDGFLVQPGNVTDLASKLMTLFALPAHERAEKGLMGRRKVKKRYSWQRIGRQLEAIYQQLGEKS